MLSRGLRTGDCLSYVGRPPFWVEQELKSRTGGGIYGWTDGRGRVGKKNCRVSQRVVRPDVMRLAFCRVS